MAHLLTVSRAARLVGVSRGTLQQRIKDGELTTFEGHIVADDLLRLYPNTQLHDQQELDRVEHIKETAFAKRIRERVLPDAETLAARVQALGIELARTRAVAEYYAGAIAKLADKVRELNAGGDSTRLRDILKIIDTIHPPPPDREHGLMARDSLLRIMAAQVVLRATGHEFFVDGADTLLDAGLRSGWSLSYGCSDGRCGKCKARVVAGKTKAVREAGYKLSTKELAEGVVLMCAHTAVTDVTLDAEEALSAELIPAQSADARVKSVETGSGGITRLHLQTPPDVRLRYLAGQEFMLHFPNGGILKLPAAGCPCDERNLHFHARDLPSLGPGDTVQVSGPRGHFILDAGSVRPLIFVAREEGFAPVKALLEHAMALDVAPALHLFWIAPQGGHYLNNLCRAWADSLDQFRYHELTSDKDLLATVRDVMPRFADCDVYLAGPNAWTLSWKTQFQLNGVPVSQLHAQQRK
jgi:CDP-4-dehydro-6-deoxyglucose reductase